MVSHWCPGSCWAATATGPRSCAAPRPGPTTHEVRSPAPGRRACWSYDGAGRLVDRSSSSAPAVTRDRRPRRVALSVSPLMPPYPRTFRVPTNEETSMTVTPHAEFPLGPFTPYDRNPILRPAGRRLGVRQRLQPGRGREGRQGRAALPRARRRHRVATSVSRRATTASTSSGTRSRCCRRPSTTSATACEDPRVTEIEGTYYLTYTAWDGTNAQLCLATSTDLFTWEKHGPLFPDFNTFEPRARTYRPRGARPARSCRTDQRPLADVLRRGLDLPRLVRRPDPLGALPAGRAADGADTAGHLR